VTKEIVMSAEPASNATYAHPGPGWWIIVPIVFWVAVLSAAG
jgi:hypothetical protein